MKIKQAKKSMSASSIIGGVGIGSMLATGFNYAADKMGHFQGLEGAVGLLGMYFFTIPLSMAGAMGTSYALNNNVFNKKNFLASLFVGATVFGGKAAYELSGDVIDYFDQEPQVIILNNDLNM